MACARTVSTVLPESHQNSGLVLPLEVEVTLKTKVLLSGRAGLHVKITRRTSKISGTLVAWNDDMASIRVDRSSVFEIPTEHIERMEIKSKTGFGEFTDNCLAWFGCCILGFTRSTF